MLCTNRPEGFGPMSQLYPHILTSCFIDTILIPLCTWLYLLTILILFALPSRSSSRDSQRGYVPGVGFRRKQPRFSRRSKDATDVEFNQHEISAETPMKNKRSKSQLGLSILYYLLLLAQIAMCVLEITRLSLADLSIGLLPFTIVTLLVAGMLRVTRGLGGRVVGWRWANLAAFVALAAVNGVKIAEETKEGIDTRKGTKYPESDELTDVAVMVGVYVVLGILEIVVRG